MRAHPAGPLHGGLQAAPESTGPAPSTAAELDALAPAVWPRHASRGDGGEVRVADVDIRELATTHGTPLFVVDEADFRGRAAEFAAAYGADRVFYAAKAFLCPKVARWVGEEGLGLDVCTGGELAVALHAGFPPERMVLHGNNKSTAELDAAVSSGVGLVVVDSLGEIHRLDAVAASHAMVQPVMVRATVGVEAHTHEFIATAHEDQKFGFPIAEGPASEAAEAVRRVLSAGHLRLVGLHSHIGSQIFDAEGFQVAAHRVVGFLAELHAEHGNGALADLGLLDLGGGFGIAYRTDDTPLGVAEMAGELRAIVERECAAAGLPIPAIAVEPGRAIAGPGTVTVYEVGTIKDVPLDGGTRRYVSVDGGMSDNIRTALYDADYDCRLVSRGAGGGEAALCRVVGKHCESGDIVVRDCWLPADLAPGDLLAVAATGAYCYSMSSGYNWLPRPAVVAVKDGAARVLLRRETFEDQLRLTGP